MYSPKKNMNMEVINSKNLKMSINNKYLSSTETDVLMMIT
jgi:hypothetical protein